MVTDLEHEYDISRIVVLCNHDLIQSQDILIYSSLFGVSILTQAECTIYKADDYSRLSDYCLRGYVICKEPDPTIIISNTALLHPSFLDRYTGYSIKFAHQSDCYYLLHNTFRDMASSKAKYYLDFLSTTATAKNVNYVSVIYVTSVAFGLFFVCAGWTLHFVNNIFYLAQNLLKTFLFCSAPNIADAQVVCTLKHYRTYTILLPLYKESTNVMSLVEHIAKMEYPLSKLDVKLVVEDDDDLTIRSIEALTLPSYFHVIKVPASKPRTKPKAMNYALEYVKGEYLVIYDAEDRPEYDQLIKASAKFENSPDAYVCSQAKLNYYNRDENLLTKLFSIEYSLWFDFFLKGLDHASLPMPLGGTSNHLKVSALKALGGWDAYNVTEDADLGIRLYLSDYHVSIIDSYTFEESPITIDSWLGQRARWIKGFIQTFFVYLRQNHSTLTGSIRTHVTIWIFIGLVTYSFLLLPWLIIATLICDSPILHCMFVINTIFALSYMYATAFVVLKTERGLMSNFTTQDIKALIIWPLYFLLHTIAAYKALYQLVTEPFIWNKTEHGVSKVSSSVHDSNALDTAL